MSKFNKNYYEQRYQNDVAGFSVDSRRAYLYKARIRTLKKLGIKAKNVLEVGCGIGPMTKYLSSNFQQVNAIDISNDAIDFCKMKFKNTNVKFEVAAAENLPFKDSSFDIIFAYDVYEHVVDHNICFKEAKRVLKRGGVLFMAVPNPQSLGARIKGKYPEYKGLPISERKKQWFGWQDDTHINLLNISEWRKSLLNSGFKIIKDGTDYWWDSPYISWIPDLPQDIICKISHRILTRISYFAPWELGENYIGLYINKD